MEETQVVIPNSFDDFIQGIPQETVEIKTAEDSLITRFANERIQWTDKINNLSVKMKKIPDIVELQTLVYTERQRAVEYYHYLLSFLYRINKSYRKQFAEKYDYYTYRSQKRFPNERNKEIQIMAELRDIIFKKELLENHSKFMDKTISTMDNIIFGIKSRIEVEQIMNGK